MSQIIAIYNESLKHITINYINERLNSNEWLKLKPLVTININNNNK